MRFGRSLLREEQGPPPWGCPVALSCRKEEGQKDNRQSGAGKRDRTNRGRQRSGRPGSLGPSSDPLLSVEGDAKETGQSGSEKQPPRLAGAVQQPAPVDRRRNKGDRKKRSRKKRPEKASGRSGTNKRARRFRRGVAGPPPKCQ